MREPSVKGTLFQIMSQVVIDMRAEGRLAAGVLS